MRKEERFSYLKTAPDLKLLNKTAEYPRLEALYLIARGIKEDKNRVGMNERVLQSKYKCNDHEYRYAKWIGTSGTDINALFEEFMASPISTIKQFLEHKVLLPKRTPTPPKLGVLDKAWQAVNIHGKKLYYNEETRRGAFVILEKIRKRIDSFVPPNVELSDIDWFVRQDCCCCGAEPVDSYGHYIIKIAGGIPVPICSKCYAYYEETSDPDIIDMDKAISTLWHYTKQLEHALSIMNG